MAKYHVLIEAVETVHYCYDEVLEAESEDEALEIATDEFNFDPSMYAGYDGEITYMSTDVTPF